jgi:actin-related protein
MAAFHSGDQVNAVVADIGSFYTKIGFAGDDAPRSYFRSVCRITVVNVNASASTIISS